MGLRKTYRKGKRFINEDVWQIEMEELGKYRRRFVQFIKIAVLASRTFSSQKIGFQSVALSFFCTMAVVPFLAVSLAVTKGLGLSDKIEALLFRVIPDNPDVINSIMTYADNILVKATSSVFGFISAAFFVWLVIWMMLCVERVFNNVWKVDENRSFSTRFWRDVAIVVISPFLMISLYASAILLTGIIDLGNFRWALTFISAVITFTAMYKFIPNTQVELKNAFKAALISGFAFTVLQLVYVESQIFLTRLSGIYGAIAAIPFFMFWLNFSWYVILVGAELSYAYQNVKIYSSELLNEAAD